MPTFNKPSKEPAKNHYETLGLHQTCTEKEVRDAFVILSKAHHPDLNPSDPNQKEKFMKIYEAYSVLSRPGRRVVYDSNLYYQTKVNQEFQSNRWNTPDYRMHRWKDESIWSMRDKTKEDFNENRPYYGIKGVKKVSNYWIAGGAVLVMMLGTLMHYAAYKHSVTFSITRLDTKDERLAKELFRVKRAASKNGNDKQMELLTEKLGWAGRDEATKEFKD